jgi:hypothetical protein
VSACPIMIIICEDNEDNTRYQFVEIFAEDTLSVAQLQSAKFLTAVVFIASLHHALISQLHKFTTKIRKLSGLSPRANYADRPSDSRLSAKLLSTFADRGCHVVSVTDPHGRIPGFIVRRCY